MFQDSDDKKGTNTLLQEAEPRIESQSKLARKKQKKQQKGGKSVEGIPGEEPVKSLEASERIDSEMYVESRNKGETSGTEPKKVLSEATWKTPNKTFDEPSSMEQKVKKQSGKDEDEAHHRAKTEKVKKAEPGSKKSSAVSSDDNVPVPTVSENKVDEVKGEEAVGKEKGTVEGNQSNQKDEREKDVEKSGKRETSKDVVGPTRREPSPDAAGKKKKSIPKALLIPAQISSRYGDPSVLHSEAVMTTSIRARENSAEASSPIKQPQSATISMKVNSAGRGRSASGTLSDGEFSFNVQSRTQEKSATGASATLNLRTEDKSSLPPKHVKKVEKKKAEGKVPSESIHEKAVASEEAGPTDKKGTHDSQSSELVVEAHEKHQSEIEPTILDGSKKVAEMSVASRTSDAASRAEDQSLSIESKTKDTVEKKKRLKPASKMEQGKGEVEVLRGELETEKNAEGQKGIAAAESSEKSVDETKLEVVVDSPRKPELVSETKEEALPRSQKDANGMKKTAEEGKVVAAEAKSETQLSRTPEKSYVAGTANETGTELSKTPEEGYAEGAANETGTMLSKTPEKSYVEGTMNDISSVGSSKTFQLTKNVNQVDRNSAAEAKMKEESSQPEQAMERDFSEPGSVIEITQEKEKSVKHVKGKKKAAEHGTSQKGPVEGKFEEFPEIEAPEREDIDKSREELENVVEITGDAQLVAPDHKKGTMKKLKSNDKKKVAAEASLAEPSEKRGKAATELHSDIENLGTIEGIDQTEAEEVKTIGEGTERQSEEGSESENIAEHRKGGESAEIAGSRKVRKERSKKKENLAEQQEYAAGEIAKEPLEEHGGSRAISLESNDQFELHDGLTDMESSTKRVGVALKVPEEKIAMKVPEEKTASKVPEGKIAPKVPKKKKEAAHLKDHDEELNLSETARSLEGEKTAENQSSDVLPSPTGKHEDSQMEESGDTVGNQKEGKSQKVVGKRPKKKAREEASTGERAPDGEDLDIVFESHPMNQELHAPRPLEEADETVDALVTLPSSGKGVINEEDVAYTSTTKKRVKPKSHEVDLIPASDTAAALDISVKDTVAEIMKPLERRTVSKEGEAMTLTIELDRPAQDIKWTKNGEVIAVSEKYDIVSEGTTCSLTIRNAEFDDAGQYGVQADESKSVTDLQISGKPRIKPSTRKVVQVEKDESIMISAGFDCPGLADDVVVSWFFNGVPLSEDAKAQIGVQGKVLKFCKRQATKADSGEYTVKLSNEFGESTEIFTVNVKGVF
ncbi:immunoglobulin I-set domain protein [Teladorsagia circumcincta]|uniref:Immunoglobulin I-set domain protein n=1 Tax=Teladorsagia circumcincta TaxID=45464 RepID=A0A2G9V0M5_TELCI|nr:immunoglobulin I-set domain protein [Teladorsagia circumcincta]